LTDDWPKYIQQAVDNMNHTPMKSCGFLQPAQINSPTMEPFARSQMLPYRHGKEISWQEQEKNQAEYMADKNNIIPGQYVLLTFKLGNFDKSFDTQVIYIYT
jgi:hypothetical protein